MNVRAKLNEIHEPSWAAGPQQNLLAVSQQEHRAAHMFGTGPM